MSNFIDECRIYVRSGDGGSGCISFRREAHTPRGGPDGGDGGKGGDVWIYADSSTSSFISLTHRPHHKAGKGTHGKGKKRHGAAGEDCLIPVPVGTQIFSEDGFKLADLTKVGERYLVMPGGVGGKGNARFLSNKRRAPAFAELGELGSETTLNLELKLLADAAIIGFPNAGKSTLISRISAAKPKIADYPFTTLEPNLGVVIMPDRRDFVVADIPGLIEGASQGKGLGHRFLRHIERAKILTVLVDLSSGDSPSNQLSTLLGEVESYNPTLLDRPRLVVGSKMDMQTEAVETDILDICVSSVVGTNISELQGMMAEVLYREDARLEEMRELSPEPVIHHPLQEKLESAIGVERVSMNSWRLQGRAVERAVAFSDLSDAEAMGCALERLANLDVDKILSNAGAGEGDTVYVGGLEFEFYADDKLDLKL